jgi:hypothetical protein
MSTLSITRISERSKTQEIQVRSMCSQLLHYCETLEGFERCFNEDILNMKRHNNFQHSFFYKLFNEQDRLELWHLNMQGEKERLIWLIK